MDTETPLKERDAHLYFMPENVDMAARGRRLRVFGSLLEGSAVGENKDSYYTIRAGCTNRSLTKTVFKYMPNLTFGQLLSAIESDISLQEIKDTLSDLKMTNPDFVSISRDLELRSCLQDLGFEIVSDITEACDVMDNPDLVYFSPEAGEIEPVSEEHVEKVMVAMQRELDRELRTLNGVRRPAVVLSELPPHIQRAITERRRYRFKQYGIGKTQWERNSFSLWDVDEDPDFIPRYFIGKAAKAPAEIPYYWAVG